MSTPILVDFAMLNPGYFTILAVAAILAFCWVFYLFAKY